MSYIDSNNNIIPQNTENVSLKIGKHQQVVVQDIEKEAKPNFIMVGSGVEINGKVNSMDYTKVLLDMTKDEGFIFKLLIDNREVPNAYKPYSLSNYTNINAQIFTATERKRLSLGYIGLRNKNVVIRVSKGRYLINPALVISNVDGYATQFRIDYLQHSRMYYRKALAKVVKEEVEEPLDRVTQKDIDLLGDGAFTQMIELGFRPNTPIDEQWEIYNKIKE